MTELLIIGYFVVATLVGIWQVGKVHAYQLKYFYGLNHPPELLVFFSAYVGIIPAVFATYMVYHDKSAGWVWPKKGVTYQ